MSGDSDATLEIMRKYLAHNSKGEKPQIARAVLVLHASKKNLLSEAEKVVAAYRKSEPIDVNELFGMETLLADGFNKVGMGHTGTEISPPQRLGLDGAELALLGGAELAS